MDASLGTSARRGRWGVRGLGTLGLLALLLTPAAGQGEREVPDPEGDLAVTDQTVAVESPTEDAAIQRRLERIFTSAERVDDLRVRVENGLVFLAGDVQETRHREWAAEVAARTEGVVAVVNDLRVAPAAIWDLTPTVRELRELWRALVQSLPLAVVGLLVLIVTLAISRGLTPVLSRLMLRGSRNRILIAALERAVGIAFVLFGVYVFLRIAGLTRIATTIVGGTGLLGLLLGLAFRDIAENLLASLLISVQRPFRLGDTIEIEGRTGLVQRVTLRGTLLMDFDGNHVQIPNALVYKSTIRNYTANPNRRLGFTIGIGFDSSISEAQRIAMQVLEEHSAILSDPPPKALVERLGAATVDLRLFAWTDGTQHDVPSVRSSLMRLVVRAFIEAGISLPDEAREVVFPSGVPVRMTAAQEAEPEEPKVAAPRPAAAEPAVEATSGERDLSSEVGGLREQARRSRAPEEGADLLNGR